MFTVKYFNGRKKVLESKYTTTPLNKVKRQIATNKRKLSYTRIKVYCNGKLFSVEHKVVDK